MLTVLHVEDDPDIRDLMSLALSFSGMFSVTSAESGPQALGLLATMVPDVIVLDVMTPGMDGPAVLKALRADPRLAKVPVAFVTAKVQPDEVAYLLSLGAVDVIAKPVDPATLNRRVQAAAART